MRELLIHLFASSLGSVADFFRTISDGLADAGCVFDDLEMDDDL